MSLANLRKSPPTAERSTPHAVDIDTFIEDAAHYSAGRPHLYAVTERSPKEAEPMRSTVKMRKATFSLGDAAIEQLKALSEQTGISRSRLIRIWADHYSIAYHDELLMSKVT